MPPVVNLFRITAEEDLGGCLAAPVCRAGIDRGCEEVVLEGIEKGGGFIVEYPRDQAAYSVCEDRGGQFSPTEDIISNRNLFGHILLADALVDAFVMAADDQQIFL